MLISVYKAEKVRAARYSEQSKCLTLKITGFQDAFEVQLFDLPEDERQLLMRALSDADSEVRLQDPHNPLSTMPMTEWMIQKDVLKEMGVKDDN